MDEATANIDFKTEKLIQSTLANCFKTCTVITIAHRIKTILNYDKILVLDNGQIIEYDTPTNLLNNINSQFYQMYLKSQIK